MPHPFTCPHCSTEFPVADEDRGFSVYCISCGQECDIPEDLGEETAVEGGAAVKTTTAGIAVKSRPKPKRASVFTSAGADKVLTKSVGDLACLCGANIPVTVEDVGTTVYCQACGAGLPVGDQLNKIAAAQATSDDATKVETSRPKFRWVRSKPAIVVFVSLIGCGGFVGYASWKDPELLPEGVRHLIRGKPPVAPPADDSAADNKNEEPDPGEPITLESIRRLLKWRNGRMALVRAQIWDSELKSEGLADDEERRAELKRVIAALVKRLTPKPEPVPAYVKEFRKQLDALGAALSKRDVEKSEKLYRSASKLFREHPQELANDSGRLWQYQGWLRKLQLLTSGVRDAKRHLDQAADTARAGRPTEALEMQARAMFGARRIPSIKYTEEKKLVEYTRKTVMPLIAWSRGRRAVTVAEELHKLGDRAARDRQIEIAADNLPPIGSKLPGVNDTNSAALNVRTRRLAKRGISNPRNTPLGAELDIRDKFEQAILHLGHGETEKFVAAAARAKAAYDRLNGKARLHDAVTRMIARLPGYGFDMISQELEVLNALPAGSRARGIPLVRRSLDHLSPWKSNPRYAAMNAALDNLSKRIVEDRLKTAKSFEKAGDLPKAIAAAKQLEQAGDAQTATAARKLREGWETELKLRASKKAKADQFAKIKKLIDAGKPLAAGAAFKLYEQRYPQEKNSKELKSLLKTLEPKLKPKIDALLKQADAHKQKSEWPQYRKALAQVAAVPLSIDHRVRLELYNKTLFDLQTRIDGHMQHARRAERMATIDEIIAVRNRTSLALSLDPNHAAAKKLHAKAKALADKTLSKMMSDAEALIGLMRRGRRGLKSRTLLLLGQISKLDKGGEYGRKAFRYQRTVRRYR